MTRRISSSRPTTGSSLPSRAASGQVDAVLLQRLVGALGVRAGHALAAAHGLEGLEQRLVAGAGLLEQALGVAAGLRRRQQQVLGGDVLVAEALGLVLGASR